MKNVVCASESNSKRENTSHHVLNLGVRPGSPSIFHMELKIFFIHLIYYNIINNKKLVSSSMVFK